MVAQHHMSRCFLFVLCVFTHAVMWGSLTYEHYRPVARRSEYKPLVDKFNLDDVALALYSYQNNLYHNIPTHQSILQNWSIIADMAIGTCAEEQKRRFMVGVMLYASRQAHELSVLHSCFITARDPYCQKYDTPQGPIANLLYDAHYNNAMTIDYEIRDKIFGNCYTQANPFVLVKKSDAMTPAFKWSFFKALAVMTHIATSLLENKKDEKEKDQKKNSSLGGFLAISDICQKMEEEVRQRLEKDYPVLKDYEIKSLISDKSWWLYDRNKWILCGSISCMVLLLLGLMYDKLPYVHYAVTTIYVH